MGEDVAVQLPFIPISLVYVQLPITSIIWTYESCVIYELLDMRRSAFSNDLLQLLTALLQQCGILRNGHDERRVELRL